ncbi:hypothetical protein EYF80_026594 [Liparis tanakae]|uniref:Uncharacterized protein n=1 Tax=Liparis tanakae TaxID=230148 RepID=A0A4Z2HC84_9TELE|nr:hypothetical protein EYF80_026594 [Liparis tanakae]
MVEQTRRPRRIVSLQAGPGEVGTDALLDMNLRINDRAAQDFGRQLAVIGDQLDREWTRRPPNWLPNALDMLRPARALTRTVYRDIYSQLRGFQGLTAAWMASTGPGMSILRADAWATWAFSLKPVRCPGWTRAPVTVALVAAVTMLGGLWVEWKA